MGLLEDAKGIVSQVFGPEVADQLDYFDDPARYPDDFLDECVFFIGKLIGNDAAKKKFELLIKKYLKANANKILSPENRRGYDPKLKMSRTRREVTSNVVHPRNSVRFKLHSPTF